MLTDRGGRAPDAGEESRRRILDATMALVADHGYDAATVSAVTAETGLPPSSIYWHFGNKDALITEALKVSWGRRRAAIPVWPTDPSEGLSLPEAVEELLNGGVQPGGHDEFLRMGLLLSVEERDPKPAALAVYREIRHQTEALLGLWWAQRLTTLGWRVGDGADITLARLTLAVLDGTALGIRAGTAAPYGFRILAEGLAQLAGHLVEHPEAIVRPAPADDFGRSGMGVVDGADRDSERAPLDSRARLVVAAEEVIAERGLDSATVSRICRKAGLPTSSLYWFFDDKDALIEAVVAEGFADWLRDADGELGEDGGKTLEESVAAALQGVDARVTVFRLGYLLLLRGGEGPASRTFIRIRDTTAERRCALYARWLGVSTELAREIARMCMLLTEGLVIGQQTDPQWRCTDFAGLLAAFLRAVGGRDDILDEPAPLSEGASGGTGEALADPSQDPTSSDSDPDERSTS